MSDYELVSPLGTCAMGVVIKVYDAGELDGIPFYTMEHLEGAVPLNALLKEQGALDLDTAVDVTRALLDALACCHAAGVLHRDLKPGNLMIGPGERVTVMDFGLVLRSRLLRTTPAPADPVTSGAAAHS